MTKAHAYGRVGLLGNPSDMYGGKCISFTIDRKAEVEIKDSLEFRVEGNGTVERSLNYNGNHDLVKAAVKRLRLQDKKFQVSYETNVPVGSGLAGSSAIVIATIRALNEHFNLHLDRYKIAETALHAEVDELGISAGFQDRYAISFEGIAYMDFTGKEYMRNNDAYGIVEHLNVDNIPFFLSLSRDPKSSALVHNDLRDRFLCRGLTSKLIKNIMDRIADIASRGKEFLLKADWGKVGMLMNRNTELRETILPHRDKDMQIIDRAWEAGALGAKVAGSGGAIIILSDNENVFNELSRYYPCFKPDII